MSDTDVVDVDAHYVESLEAVANYMEEPWKTRLCEGDDIGLKQFFPSSTGDRYQWGKIKREHSAYPNEQSHQEIDDIPAAMDFLGVDKTVMISHLMLMTPSMTADDDREAAFATGLVEYLDDQVVDSSKGIYSLAPIPYYDVDASLAMLDKIENKRGFVGGCFITGGANPPLGNRKYEPIYERMEEMGLPIIYHTGGSGLDQYIREGYESFIETHVLGFLESNMSQLVSVVAQGIPEKFPDLDIIFMESGILWIPMIAYRLDDEYMKRTDEAPLLEKRPSEYISEFYFGTQPFEDSTPMSYLKETIDIIGSDKLLYASDYPHWDFDHPEKIANLPFLDEEDTRNIMGANANEVFDL